MQRATSQVTLLIRRQFCGLYLRRRRTRSTRDTLKRPSVCGNAMCSALGIHNPCRNVKVVDAIAGLMVTLIVSNTCLAVPPVTKRENQQ